MSIDLRNDVFVPVLARVKKRVESLRSLKRFQRTGIEGWFKVEIVAALDKKVKAIHNKGPDLEFEDGTKLELKAATNFDRGWFLEPLRKYRAPCLFLGNAPGLSRLTATDSGEFEVVGSDVFPDGFGGEWIIGLVKPRR
ncbi:MAG: hypothetical protein J7M08_09450 [Planctomycetes bacterium]|nr:hypothetical protein [Planctomycetota bacterium]